MCVSVCVSVCVFKRVVLLHFHLEVVPEVISTLVCRCLFDLRTSESST